MLITEPIRKNEVTHLIWISDGETNFMYKMMLEEGDSLMASVCKVRVMARDAGVWRMVLKLWILKNRHV
jgi:hypothetical protein